MPAYLLNLGIWKALWPFLVFPLATAFVVSVILGSKPFSAHLPLVFAQSLLGMVIGNITALSREAAVGAAMPAVLTLLGGRGKE